MPRFFKYILIGILEWFGFVHWHRWSLQGPRSRLHIAESEKSDFYRLGYAGCLFNTMSGSIRIGKNVMMGHEVRILTGRHDDTFADPLIQKPTIREGFDITIEDGVWLTTRVIVTGGVKIGQNTTVLPGSVVTKDMPSDCIVGGIPARVISKKQYA